MKIKNLLFITCLSLCAAYSCSNDEEPSFGIGNEKFVKFTAAIESQTGVLATKAAGTTWDKGDAIGIYMKSGQTNQALNVKYTTSGDGVFSAATTGIEFPSDGSNVDFIAYYPYQSTITDLTYPINVANQASLPTIDLLYSNNAVNTNKNDALVGLNFKHMLSLLALNITAGDGISSLSGASITITGVTTEGTFNLEDGTVTLGSTKGTVNPAITANTSTATVNAILLPGQDLAATKLSFTLNGKVYEWTPSVQNFESSKKYTYSVQLSATGITVLDPNGTIEDWTEGNPGGSGVVLTPNQDSVFVVDKTSLALGTAASTNTISLTTQDDQAWTASVDAGSASWLSVSSASGTGSATLSLSAIENTTTQQRSATVTITASNNNTFAPIAITVVQDAASSTTEPTQSLLFSGADFEDWNVFLASLNSYGLKSGYTSQSAGNGRNNSAGLYLNGTPTANDYVFTALTPAGGLSSTPTKIAFYVKGTSAKSLSMNVYLKDGTYKAFNLGDCTADATLEVSATNSYTGTINTSSQWVKVVLNLSGLDVATAEGANVFALKVGKEAAYDLLVDDITFE